jgi:hypothetical protein
MHWSSADDSLHIWGSAWGGEDNGAGYNNAQVYDIDFLFSEVTHVSPTEMQSTPAFPNGSGTITPNSINVGPNAAGVPIALVDYEGHHPASFFVGLGHRGEPGISGWGWVKHSGKGYNKSSDWIFTAHQAPIPEPGSMALFGVGALIVGNAIRRKRGDVA